MVSAIDQREACSFAPQLSSEGTAMGYKGITKGKLIELEEPLPFADGTWVEVTVTPVPQPRKGSPQAVLQLAGTLTSGEADAILHAAQACRRIDWDLWERQP
jgi:hypothetical protein